MEQGVIHREVQIEASPAVVYEVVSRPEHLRQWWPDDADLDPTVGASGTIWFGDRTSPDAKVAALTVVEADPPRRFVFRWVEDEGGSLLVTFDLVPSGQGTLLRFSETGFRDKGWAPVEQERALADHTAGWDRFLPRLVTYAAGLAMRP